MATVSKVAQLPTEVRAWLDQQLVNSGFGNYSELTDQLNEKLASHELEFSVSRSGLGVYGKNLKDRIQKIKHSTEAARLLNDTMDDDGDALAIANIALAQDIIFNLMNKIDPDDEDQKINIKEITLLFRSLGNISRASLPLKQWNKKVREELARKKNELAAEINDVEGLSDDQAAVIRAKILGLEIDV